MRKRRPVIVGMSGALGLLIIYVVTLTLVNSPDYLFEQLRGLWYWIVILTGGFGTQLGLYSYIKYHLHRKVSGTGAEVATSGGISTASMIACCAHRIVDFLPIIGLSAAALFLVKYQLPFIIMGIFSNLVGIILLLNVIQKHKLYSSKGALKTLFRVNMKTLRGIMIPLSIVVVSFSFLLFSFKSATPVAVADDTKYDLPAKINDENSVSVKVKPVEFSFNKPVKFEITVETHAVDLNFDITKISYLEDDKGNIYNPLKWDGTPPGGHHRSGILSFPDYAQKTKLIKLTLKGISRVPERVFIWELP